MFGLRLAHIQKMVYYCCLDERILAFFKRLSHYELIDSSTMKLDNNFSRSYQHVNFDLLYLK